MPFVVWCAAQYLDDYTEALWTTVTGLGHRDITCAIVGGLVAGSIGADTIPSWWLKARKALPVDFYDRDTGYTE